jgi:hypothetical protein
VSATAPELLFVFAGSEPRKRYAIDAWRRGAAPMLAVSVARFEWRRVPALQLPEEGGLVALVNATAPRERLFLLVVTGARVEARRVAKGPWGTWSEALGLAALARERGFRSVLVCTSDYHLARSMLAARRALDLAGMRDCALTALAASEAGPRSARERVFRWLEGFKWLVYASGVPMFLQPPARGTSAAGR